MREVLGLRRMTRRKTLVYGIGLALSSSVLLGACGSGDGNEAGGTGTTAGKDIGTPITTPRELAAFEPGSAGAKPDLPKRIALAMDNDREFAQRVKLGIEAAAKARGLEFVSANANGDSAKNIQQIEQFLAQGVGAIVINPIDQAAQAPVMEAALKKGIAVMSLVTPPASLQANADQYAIGKVVADDAVEYIKTELGGKANVVILNQDSIEPVRPRFRAMREALKTVPGAKIVADVEPEETQKDSAFETMNTILQKNPQVDVVLGADAVVLGAYAALQAAGKDTPRQYLGGIDGEPEALAAIREGGAYKASVALAPVMFGYAMGNAAGDWLDGKPIPQALDIAPVLLDSPESIDQYEADKGDPGATFADTATREKYVRMLGSISYETRGNYLTYVWAP